jgi:hypothetical protein
VNVIDAVAASEIAAYFDGVLAHFLDHIIAINEAHLRRLLSAHVTYHHEDRIHDALGKDTPKRRAIEPRRSPTAEVISMSRLSGLHHRYLARSGLTGLHDRRLIHTHVAQSGPDSWRTVGCTHTDRAVGT